MIPFLGTTLGASCVFFMKKSLGDLVQRSLAGFAAGVMVAASIWSLLIPAIEQSEDMGKLLILVCAIGICKGAVGMVHLYSPEVQDRCVTLGLITHEKIKRDALFSKRYASPDTSPMCWSASMRSTVRGAFLQASGKCSLFYR